MSWLMMLAHKLGFNVRPVGSVERLELALRRQEEEYQTQIRNLTGEIAWLKLQLRVAKSKIPK